MKVKVNDATLIQLNWMVAKCKGFIKNETWFDHRVGRHFIRVVKNHSFEDHVYWEPSTDWSQGGPIIEREGIGLLKVENRLPHQQWDAGETDEFPNTLWAVVSGPTPLIAAMRCYVASKLGDEVDVPEELV
jgi:hypothetical protein